MTVSTLLFATGALLEGWLAALLLVGWHSLRASRARWPLLLACGFASNTLRTALLASGYGNVALDAFPLPWTSTLAALAIGLLTSGLIDFVGLRPDLARRLNAISAAVLAATLFATLMHWLNRGAGQMVGVVFFMGWAVLFLHALRREPNGGHALVLGALLTFPVGAVAVRGGALPFVLMPIIELVPVIAVGLTVLTTGLIRANRRAQEETARTALALAARAQAEAQLRTANETLEQRVAMRTAELRETIEGLESFNRSVAHDLRGPLGGIAGVAKLARELVAERNAAQVDRMLETIARQADTSMALVASLLALARAGDAQPHRSAVDAGALVDEIVATTQPAAAAKGPAPAIAVLPLPVVDADRELLRQVFVNLIGNACKFAAGAAAPRVEIGHAATPDGAAFFVRDNGVGFAQADAQRMFKPFERLHGARYEGFGVGLSIVRRIIDHHGGRIWAEGVPGQGATFWFTLGGA